MSYFHKYKSFEFQTIILMKDNFNDNSIDNNLWTLTNPNSLISEVNNRIEISNPRFCVVGLAGDMGGPGLARTIG